MNRYDTTDSKPEREVGSIMFAGWAGLYEGIPFEGWYLIERETPEGVITQSIHTNSEALLEWENIVEELDIDMSEPDSGDFVISWRGDAWQVYPTGETFPLYPDSLRHIRSLVDDEDLELEEVTIWLVNRHGGFSVVTEDLPKVD